jgi:hypothetical protein
VTEHLLSGFYSKSENVATALEILTSHQKARNTASRETRVPSIRQLHRLARSKTHFVIPPLGPQEQPRIVQVAYLPHKNYIGPKGGIPIVDLYTQRVNSERARMFRPFRVTSASASCTDGNGNVNANTHLITAPMMLGGVETSVGQANFIKFCIQTGLVDYCKTQIIPAQRARTKRVPRSSRMGRKRAPAPTTEHSSAELDSEQECAMECSELPL